MQVLGDTWNGCCFDRLQGCKIGLNWCHRYGHAIGEWSRRLCKHLSRAGKNDKQTLANPLMPPNAPHGILLFTYPFGHLSCRVM